MDSSSQRWKADAARRSCGGGGALAAATVAARRAQSFPTGPVRIVVAVGAGASPGHHHPAGRRPSVAAWGQQVIVINQPGGAGAVAIRRCRRAAGRQHALHVARHQLHRAAGAAAEFPGRRGARLRADRLRRRAAADDRRSAGARREHAARADRAAQAEAQGELNFGAGNRGSILHLTAEWLRIASGIDVTLVHYASASQAMTDLMGGRVQAMIDATHRMRGAIEGGKLKPLAVASRDAAAFGPDLPAVAETIPGFEAMGWMALMAPPARRCRSRTRSATICAPCWPSRSCRSASRISAPTLTDHAGGAHRLHPRAAAHLAAGDRGDREGDTVTMALLVMGGND